MLAQFFYSLQPVFFSQLVLILPENKLDGRIQEEAQGVPEVFHGRTKSHSMFLSINSGSVEIFKPLEIGECLGKSVLLLHLDRWGYDYLCEVCSEG
jgi:hypothetical protein